MNQETEIIEVTRDDMIQHLTESMFDFMETDAEYRWMLCQIGFKGYNNMTNDELLQEYKNYITEDPEYPVIVKLEEV